MLQFNMVLWIQTGCLRATVKIRVVSQILVFVLHSASSCWRQSSTKRLVTSMHVSQLIVQWIAASH